jgi:hypothetical protein
MNVFAMKYSKKRIDLIDIDLSAKWLQVERENLFEIGKVISQSTLDAFCELHPIFVAASGDDRYRVVAGDAQIRLARAVGGPDIKLTVRVLSAEDVDFLIAVERTVSPLALAQSPENIEETFQELAASGQIHRLGRDFDRPDTVRKMLKPLISAAKRPYARQAVQADSSTASATVSELPTGSEQLPPDSVPTALIDQSDT